MATGLFNTPGAQGIVFRERQRRGLVEARGNNVYRFSPSRIKGAENRERFRTFLASDEACELTLKEIAVRLGLHYNTVLSHMKDLAVEMGEA